MKKNYTISYMTPLLMTLLIGCGAANRCKNVMIDISNTTQNMCIYDASSELFSAIAEQNSMIPTTIAPQSGVSFELTPEIKSNITTQSLPISIKLKYNCGEKNNIALQINHYGCNRIPTASIQHGQDIKVDVKRVFKSYNDNNQPLHLAVTLSTLS